VGGSHGLDDDLYLPCSCQQVIVELTKWGVDYS